MNTNKKWDIFRKYSEQAKAGDSFAVVSIISTIQPVYHGDKKSKIYGLASVDSSCSECSFCQMMQASGNPRLICNRCYDRKIEIRLPAVKAAHAYQLHAWSEIEYTVDALRETIKIPRNAAAVRFNSSGDIENAMHAANYIRLAKAFPNTRFALWTKNIQAIRAAVAMEGKPENLILIYSVPTIDEIPEKLPEPFDYAFAVYSTPERLQAAIAAGAAECNGKKCKECGYKCYTGEHDPDCWLIAEALR